MTNRISDLFDDDDIPVPNGPTSDDLIIVTYTGEGRYSVLVQNPNTPAGALGSLYRAMYIGTLGRAIRVSEGLIEELNPPSDQMVEGHGVWFHEAIRMILSDPDYTWKEDLTAGEYHWWVELNQYGPYPGDDWFDEKMDDRDEEELDDLDSP
jgi:hypothetical protein